MRESKEVCEKLKERANEEESLVTLNELEQIHTEVNDMVVSDKQALTEDRDQFSCEIDRIGEISVPTVAHSSGVTLSCPHRQAPE